MIRHGLFDVPTNPKPSSSLLNSIYALYHKDVFLGSCFAIAPLVIVSAGHHYNTTKDDVGDFSILSGTSKWTKAEYGAKNPNHDMAVFWLVEPVPCFLPLRGHFPRTQSHVATIWLSLKPPHEHIISPGVVMNSNHETCLIKGTVSTTGSSGAPVVDFFGTHFVGIHLTSNTRDGSRVSGCLTARKMALKYIPTQPSMSANDSRVDVPDLQLSGVELFSGAVAGFAEHFVMFPFDTIKTRVQSGNLSSIRHALRQVWREERLTNLYRGCTPVLVAAVPAHAVYFSFYESSKRLFGEGNVGIAAAACVATVGHDVVSTPFDVVKQRMQMDHHRSFSSSLHCFMDVFQKGGIKSLTLSLPTTILMNIPHYATYWLVYETMMRQMHDGETRDYGNEASSEYLVSGFLAGAAASFVSFPLDTIKTSLQLGYSSSLASAWRHLTATGMRRVYSGVMARIMYTAPSGAIMMLTYETVKGELLRSAS